MNTRVAFTRIRQWHARSNEGEACQVVGRDPDSGAIETEALNGGVGEIDLAAWIGMPLGFGEPPEGWARPLDDED